MKKSKSIKILALSLAFLICSTYCIFAGSLFGYQRSIGDVNDDRTISIVDALILAQAYVGMVGAEAYLPFADPSNDDKIDIVDALLVARYYVGLTTEFARKSPIIAVEEWARANNANLTGYGIFAYGTKETAAILPGYSFVVLIITQYPVAYGPEDPLIGKNAIAAVDKNLGVEVINDVEELVQFFAAHQVPATDLHARLLTVKAWLHLSQELKDDGFFTFTVLEDSLQELPTGSIQAEGITEVTAGGTGAIKANVWFGTPELVIYQVVEQVELVPGVRPICQSTKLLDKDPVVRKMAEQDLLVMGLSCRDYLFTQRAKSSTELKKAIDAIWARILEREKRLEKVRELSGR